MTNSLSPSSRELMTELQSLGLRLIDPSAGAASRRGGAGPSDHKAVTIDGHTIMVPVHTRSEHLRHLVGDLVHRLHARFCLARCAGVQRTWTPAARARRDAAGRPVLSRLAVASHLGIGPLLRRGARRAVLGGAHRGASRGDGCRLAGPRACATGALVVAILVAHRRLGQERGARLTMRSAESLWPRLSLDFGRLLCRCEIVSRRSGGFVHDRSDAEHRRPVLVL